MVVTNKTKKTLLTGDLKEAKTIPDSLLGLTRYKIPRAMLLKTCFGIHTFGMTYAIDVLILDKENKVVAIKKSLKPNRIFLWNPRYKTVLELPEGTIEKTKTVIGDLINLQ